MNNNNTEWFTQKKVRNKSFFFFLHYSEIAAFLGALKRERLSNPILCQKSALHLLFFSLYENITQIDIALPSIEKQLLEVHDYRFGLNMRINGSGEIHWWRNYMWEKENSNIIMWKCILCPIFSKHLYKFLATSYERMKSNMQKTVTSLLGITTVTIFSPPPSPRSALLPSRIYSFLPFVPAKHKGQGQLFGDITKLHWEQGRKTWTMQVFWCISLCAAFSRWALWVFFFFFFFLQLKGKSGRTCLLSLENIRSKTNSSVALQRK